MICAALLGLATAHATTTTFWDLSNDAVINNIQWNAATGTFTALEGGQLCTTVSGQQARATVSFTLNLTAAANAQLTEKVALFTIDSNTDFGLWLTPTGISGRWNNDEYNTRASNNSAAEYSGVVSITSIMENNTNVFTVEGNTYIGLTLVADKACDNNNTGNVGLTLYDAAGDRVWYCEALGSADNQNYDGFILNTDYIDLSASITPSVLSSTAAGQAAALIPEPATATLSLLALAGLAARRRRK